MLTQALEKNLLLVKIIESNIKHGLRPTGLKFGSLLIVFQGKNNVSLL